MDIKQALLERAPGVGAVRLTVEDIPGHPGLRAVTRIEALTPGGAVDLDPERGAPEHRSGLEDIEAWLEVWAESPPLPAGVHTLELGELGRRRGGALWELINPSDAYTLQGGFKAVALATLLLGEGRYAAREVRGDREVPILFTGAREWFRERFGQDIDVAAQVNRKDMADALDSVMIGSPQSRQAYETALRHIPEAGRAAYRAEVLDGARSSINDIGERAWRLAAALRTTGGENGG